MIYNDNISNTADLESKLRDLLPTCTYMEGGKYVIVKVIRFDSITFTLENDNNKIIKDHLKENYYKFLGLFRLKKYEKEEDKKRDDNGKMPGTSSMYFFEGYLIENEKDKSIKVVVPINIRPHN